MSEIDWPRVLGFIVVAVAIWLVTGALKAASRMPCDLARKTNHVFALAGGALWFGWLSPDVAEASTYAAAALLLMLVLVVCGLQHRAPFRFAFLANTRKSDAPHEALYFWSSWFLSMAALAGVQIALNDVVITRTAALLVGIGDGIAEPIGRRFGRHRYRVPSLTSGSSVTRSLEGSAAVFAGCFVTLIACFGWAVFAGSLLIALVLTLVEAISPHGLDNLTLPVVAALVLRPLLAI